jgi:hypothetical protein
MAHASTHKEPDDTFCFCFRSGAWASQQVIESHSSKPKACTLEKTAAIDGVGDGWINHDKN